MRILLSILTAVLATAGGLALAWHGASTHRFALGQLQPEQGLAGFGVALLVAGLVLLLVVGLSLALHWIGALLVGAVHTVLGLLALLLPFGSLQEGFGNPVFQVLSALPYRDPMLNDGATVFYFSGVGLAVGLLLIVAALAVRARRRATQRAGVVAVVVSVLLGGIAMLGASSMLVLLGGQFVQNLLVTLRSVQSLAIFALLAAVLIGAAAVALRWSVVGVAVTGALLTLGGIVLLWAPTLAPMNAPGVFLGSYGGVAILGAVALGTALGAAVGRRRVAAEEPQPAVV